jgi:hypothetical protein
MKHHIEDVVDSIWGVKEITNNLKLSSGQESGQGGRSFSGAAGTQGGATGSPAGGSSGYESHSRAGGNTGKSR